MSTQYPINIEAEDGVKDFILSFYELSDMPGKHEEWLGFYSTDAVLVMANDRAEGHQGMSPFTKTSQSLSQAEC